MYSMVAAAAIGLLYYMKSPQRVNFGGERSMVKCFVYPSSEAGMVGIAPFCVQTKALTFTASL